MAFIWAALIGGGTCVLGQILSELKIPFPIVAILFTSLGGILTGAGLIPALQALGSGGISVTAVGCGNGAYNAGIEAISANPVALLLVLGLNILLVAGGAVCGCSFAKKQKA